MPDSTTPTVPSPAYSREFQAKRQNGKNSNRSVKFDHLNGLGQTLSDPICWLVISAVETMNTNGSRNMIDREMATEWLAIASSRRRRRIAAGTCRRGIATAPAPGVEMAVTGTPPG